MNAPVERDYLGKALDIAVRLAVIGFIVFGALRIFSPFLPAVVWGAIIAIALFPIFTKLRSMLGGRNKVAASVFVILALAAILGPTVWLTDSLLDGTVRIVRQAEEGTLEVPPPTEKVKEWAFIGDKVYELWNSAHLDLKGTVAKMQPQLSNFGEKIISSVSGLGGALVLSLFSLIIAGILMASSEGAGRAGRKVAIRLAGEEGPEMMDLAVGTIRSVVKGVILVAIMQSLLAAVGLVIAGVPFAGLWAVLVLVVAVIQLPPIIILGPLIPYVFAHNDNTAISIFFLIWSLVVSGSDGWLKPIFLGRGVNVPMLVILIGAIGGMLGSGVLGLFIGPVVLAIAWMLFMAWVREDDPPASTESATETT